MVLIRRAAFVLFLVLSSGCSMLGLDTPVDSAVYIVQPGDTLFDIGRRFGVSQTELMRMNHLADARSLHPGQPLEIPQRPRLKIHNSTASNGREAVEKKRFRSARDYLGGLSWPVRAIRLGSSFGFRNGKFHDGVDLTASEGTPIFAAHDADVIYSGHQLSGYGNIVILRASSLLTIYAHNSRNLVNAGDSVTRGEQIAEVGSTGHATGPHVHFEVRLLSEDGKYYAVDPLKFLKG